MPDGMSAEQEIKHEDPQLQANDADSGNALSPESLIDHSIFVGWPQIPRRADITARKEEEAQVKFTENLGLLRQLGKISEGLNDSPLEESEPFQQPDTDALRIAYDEAPRNERKRYSSGTKTFIENRERRILGQLNTDILKLLKDTGLPDEEVDLKMRGLFTSEVRGKRRDFHQLPGSSKISILENAAKIRQNWLIRNFPAYMYFLNYGDTTESRAMENREAREIAFRASDEEDQARIAAETRTLAKTRIREVFDANLMRLSLAEESQGKNKTQLENEMADLRKVFNESTLDGKVKTIDRVQKRKVKAILPHLENIRNLRTTMEDELDAPAQVHDSNLSEEGVLAAEVGRITSLYKNFQMVNNPSGEVTVGDLRNHVVSLSLSTQDNSLTAAFDYAMLSRLDPSDLL